MKTIDTERLEWLASEHLCARCERAVNPGDDDFSAGDVCDGCAQDLLAQYRAELAEARETIQRLNRRASALPQWQKFSELTKEQRTGRFFPALMRMALTDAEAENNELKAELAAIKGMTK